MTLCCEGTYAFGESVGIPAVFRAAGVLVDPTSVNFTVRRPGGAVATYAYGTSPEVARDGVGSYSLSISASTAGTWFVYINSTGVVKAAKETSFIVLPKWSG